MRALRYLGSTGTLGGLDDVVITGAATEIRRECFSNLGLGWIRMIAKECRQREQDAGSAESALKPVLDAKRRLQSVQSTIGTREAFDGLDFMPKPQSRDQAERARTPFSPALMDFSIPVESRAH